MRYFSESAENAARIESQSPLIQQRQTPELWAKSYIISHTDINLNCLSVCLSFCLLACLSLCWFTRVGLSKFPGFLWGRDKCAQQLVSSKIVYSEYLNLVVARFASHASSQTPTYHMSNLSLGTNDCGDCVRCRECPHVFVFTLITFWKHR